MWVLFDCMTSVRIVSKQSNLAIEVYRGPFDDTQTKKRTPLPKSGIAVSA